MKRIWTTWILASWLFISCNKSPTGSEVELFTWNSSTPEAQKMRSQVLDSAFVQAQQLGFVDGLLVIRNGFIVGEKYYNGHHVWTPHNVMSVSKSFLSALTGLALQQGYLMSLDAKMLDYFPEYIYPGMDNRKHAITIRHLLTMHMGIANEADNNYGIYWGIYNSNNWIKTTIEYPLKYAPGERMSYNTFQTHLLSAIITKATGKSTLEFARQNLFNPMGITVDAWEKDPQGYYFGGNSMHFVPREMAVLGYLYLNEGVLNNVRIVPREWVHLTTTAFTNWQNRKWGAFTDYNYGYLWWLGKINNDRLFMAYGYGGQFVVNFPDLNLIVVSTAKNQVDPDTSTIQEWAIFDIISKHILPAVMRS
jgi:CubicO group peptidase (beta-lactamase class C family)